MIRLSLKSYYIKVHWRFAMNHYTVQYLLIISDIHLVLIQDDFVDYDEKIL